MNADLTDNEKLALVNLLKRAIDEDRYPLSERVETWKAILAKLAPEPAQRSAPPPPPKIYAPTSKGRYRARRG